MGGFMNNFRLFFALLLTMALFNSTANSLPKSRAGQMVIAVQLYSFRNQIKEDLPGTLAKIKAMGINQIESYPHGLASAKAFRAMLDKAGLTCFSTHADYDSLAKNLDGVARNAKTIGAKYVIVPWIPHGDKFTPEDCNRTIVNFNKWAAQLARRGLRFGYHIHGYEFQPYGTGTLFDKLMMETTEYVSIQLDTFHVAYPGQDPLAILKKYPKRIESLHLKDLKKGTKGDLSGGGDVELNVQLGTGMIDIAGIVRTARKLGIKYQIIEDESSQVMQQVPESLKYLKSL
jgi:sugar phosphate isomerase/epimerase